MLKRLLIITTLAGICVPSAYSLTTDYRFEAFSRSIPLGLYAKVDIAASQKIWGNVDKKKPLYSFIRARSSFQTSGLINSVRPVLEYYPIAPIAFYSGLEYMRRDLNDLDQVECEQVTCEASSIKRKIWGMKMAMAYQSLSMLIDIKWHSSKLSGTNNFGYFEEQGTLIGKDHYDILRQIQVALMYKLNDEQALIGMHKRNQTKLSNQKSQMSLLLFKQALAYPFDTQVTKNRGFSLLIGGGAFHTRNHATHPTVVALLQWRPKMGLTLF